MKKKFLFINAMALAVLCACAAKENDNKPIMTPTPTATVAPTETPLPTVTPTNGPTPTPTLEVLAQWYINGLERMDISELNGFVDKEDSIRNSNLLNYGYVTYDDNGKIYYLNQNEDAIYCSDYNGENKRLICKLEENMSGSWLQLSGEWLYFNTQKAAIRRVHIVTGEIEDIMGEYSGDFLLEDEKIYTNYHGLSVTDSDGQKTEMLDDTLQYCYLPTYGEDYGISRVSGKKQQQMGYLLVFDGKSTKVLKQRGSYPLLVGNYLCMSDVGSDALTTKFRVWNLKTNREYQLGTYANQTVVSDGETIYFSRDGYNNQIGRMWNGEELAVDQLYTFVFRWKEPMKEPELFWIITEGNGGVFNIFLTPKAIYAQDNTYDDNKFVDTLFYYDLETGETGQVY